MVRDLMELKTEMLQAVAEINGKCPTVQRMLKFAFNLTDTG